MAEVSVNAEELIGPVKPSREPRSPWHPGPEKTGTEDEDDDMLIVFTDESPEELRAAFRKLWGVLLLMSVRDRATSVHYHPWRGDGALFYIVDDARYEMVPPPAEHADVCVNTARDAFIAPAGFFARLFGCERVACGTLSLDVGGLPVVWDVVVWTSGPRRGVDLHRITPLELRNDSPQDGANSAP